MTNTPDTSPEAVERMAEWLYDLPCCHDSPQHRPERCKQCERTVAATLRALSAERDEWKAAAQRHHPNPTDFRYWEGRYRDEKARAESAEARERALLQSNDQERKALVESASLRHRLKAAEAELAEAKMLLSQMVNHAEWRETNDGVFWEATDKARAFRARHQKETGV